MKLLLTVLLLTALQANSQSVIVQATNYLKANSVTSAAPNRGIVVNANSWADYSVTVPVGGYYEFAFTIRNPNDQSHINIKTPTGSTNIGSVLVPSVTYWRYARGIFKLRAGTTRLRLLFGGDFFLDAFTYKYTPDTAKAKPFKPNNEKYITQKEFEAFVKEINERVIKFSPDHFKVAGEDSAIELSDELMKLILKDTTTIQQ